jgi:hypothetical protein
MCVDQINKFDTVLVDLRKYGFGIITGVGTTSSLILCALISLVNTFHFPPGSCAT